jgi:putative transcriptional regulator
LALSVKNRMRELRAAQGWSQADLGGKLGVSRQTVNAIEAGRYDPSLPLAFRIGRVFGLSIEAIFEAEANPCPVDAPEAAMP